MSCKELIESLRKTADERVRLLQEEAEREARAIKADLSRRLEERRADAIRMQEAARRDAAAQALSSANVRARLLRLSAEQALSARLRDAAGSCLAVLRDAGYDAVFEKLARELPAVSWKTVRVNPGDVALAGKIFPGAEIVPDPSITGGMDVSARDGSIRVANTFEKRLERAWGDMLPLLIREIYREVSDGVPAAS